VSGRSGGMTSIFTTSLTTVRNTSEGADLWT